MNRTLTRKLAVTALVALGALTAVVAEAAPRRDREVRKEIIFNEDGSLVVDGLFYGSALEFQSSSEFVEKGHRCATPNELRNPRNPSNKAAADCTMVSTTIRSEYAPANGGVYQIPVVWHIVRKTDGTGEVSDALINSQMAILNEDFRAIAGTPGGPGNDTKIQFVLATTNPTGGATTGINRYTNNTWFADPGPGATNAMKQNLRWDPTRYFNIYTNDAAGNLGYATFPQEDAGTYQDGVVLLWSSVGRNAPSGGIYNQGRTATHEIGHYLGLFHTFQSGCGTTYSSGDLIVDTEPQSTSTFNCPSGATSCGGARNPIENYMNYTQDTCMWRFTIEQANRMRCSLTSYRGGLYTTIGGGGGNNPPTANFTFSTSNLTASFTDTSSDSDGTIASRSWTFGDGGTSTATNPTRTYAAAGTYNVSLTVTDDDGATGSTTKAVAVSAGITALSKGVAVTGLSGSTGAQRMFSFAVPSGASNLTFNLSGGTGDADLYVRFGSQPTTSTYDCRSWASGNTESCSFASPSTGTYYALVHAYSTYSGAQIVANYTTTTNTPPTANFTFTTSNLTATFTDTSTDAGGSVVAWSWNFGDSTTSTTRNPVKTYSSAGTRTVSLTVTDNGGLTGATSKSVTVSSTPTCTAVSESESNNTTSSADPLVAPCSTVAGTFSTDTNQNDYFRMTVPAGATITGLLNGLTVDYDLYLYRSGSSTAVASSTNGGTTADQASWTNTTGASTTVYVRVYRYSSTRTTYALRVSY